jgi:hypothetical protein
MCPPLNPYFIYQDGKCSGIWSDEIVAEVNWVRPHARFEELSDTFGDILVTKDGRTVIPPDYPRSRVLSLKLENYNIINGTISIQ